MSRLERVPPDRSIHGGCGWLFVQREEAIGDLDPGFEVERIGGNDGVVETHGAHGLASGK